MPFISEGEANVRQGMEVKGNREYVRSAVEASLERLNVKQIDVYYQVDTISILTPRRTH